MKTENFIWSQERQALYMRCPRAYYHLQFGTNDDVIARQLTCLQTLDEWSCNMIRKSIASALAEYASSGSFLAKDELQNLALANMRESWMEYLNGAWKNNPEHATNIFELYYGNEKEYGTLRKLPQNITDEAKANILNAMDAFYYSPFLRSLADLDKSQWHFYTSKDTFRLGDICVQEAPDFTYMEKDGTITALFWTFGNEYRPFLRIRQACCKLFAMERYSLPSNKVNVSTVLLNDGGRSSACIVNDANLSWARQQLLKGAELLLAKANASKAKEDYAPRPDASCNNCKYKRLCLES